MLTHEPRHVVGTVVALRLAQSDALHPYRARLDAAGRLLSCALDRAAFQRGPVDVEHQLVISLRDELARASRRWVAWCAVVADG